MRFEQSYTIGNSSLNIRFGDIAEATTEVIVTSDDQQLSMGGGTSKAIRSAAGESIYAATRPLIPVPLGGVVSTTAGDLAARGVRHIFHAATIPSALDRAVEDQAAVVRNVTLRALTLLRAMGLTRIALPALGTGFAKFDQKTSGAAMADVIRDFLSQEAGPPLHVQIWIFVRQMRVEESLAFLSEITERAHLSPHAVRSHAVVLVHGIRTAADWRERIGDEIERADPGLTPVPVGYEFFDLFHFLNPIGPWRRRAAETVWMKFKALYENPNIDRVSIVAHSFGTWIVGHLLQTKPTMRFHRIILCGAILDGRFDWQKVANKTTAPEFVNARNARILNDCGTRDAWPIFAKFATWGYGAAGRWGFQHSLVRDRFHKLDHSGFFQEGFARDYWVPALTRSELAKGIDTEISPPWWLSILTVLKLPYLAAAGALLWYMIA